MLRVATPDVLAPPDLLARPDLRGWYGMCASTHWLGSAAGQAVLERGGNAFDAAVATAFVLHVVEPHLNGPGGDMVALIAPVGEQPLTVVGQGPAPEQATIDHFEQLGLEMVPGAGALAAAVPGAVDAWLMLLRDRGTWELGDVLSFAIYYARRGHVVLPREADAIAGVAELFQQHWPTSASQWLPQRRAPAAGDVLFNHAYASTLERLVNSAVGTRREDRIDAARAEWSGGFVAEQIDEFVANTPHRHASGGVHRGVLRRSDLLAFRASYEVPLRGGFRGHEIVKAGPWTQGPALLQALAILDGFTDAELDLRTAPGVHRVIEALKLTMADRDGYYGEAMADSTLHALLSSKYAESRRALIGPAASHELRPGVVAEDVHPYRPPLTLACELAGVGDVGEPTVSTTGAVNGDTCHLDIVDQWGNVVAATPSGGWLQSSPTIPGLGFALGTRLQMSWLDPASPSSLAPGRRPRTTLTPSLLMRGNEVVGAFGTPGGDQQEQWQLVFLVNLLVGGKTLQEAIEAPMFHTTSFPGSFWPRQWSPGEAVVEDRLGDDVIDGLRTMGHHVRRAGPWALGRLSAVSRDPATGLLSAAANPRGAQGYAVGR